MGFMLLIFTFSIYDMLVHFKLDYLIQNSLVNRILFHAVTSILMVYSVHLMNEINFNFLISIGVVIITIILNEYRLHRNKESDFS